MKTHLKIRVIKDISGFQGLSEEWNMLLSDCKKKNVFLTWEWLYTWWKVYGLNNDKLQLCLIELRDEYGRLLGVAPMKIRKTISLNCFEFIGNGADVVSEYLKIIDRKGYEYVVRESVKGFLREVIEFNVANLKPLQIQNIDDWNSPIWAIKKIKKISTFPVVDLPKAWNEFLENQSANFVKKAKEYYRVCQRDLKLKFIRISSKKNYLYIFIN